MPEGPQVHLVAQRHAALFGGKRLRFSSPDGRSDDIAATFDGLRLARVDALGKHLLYVFTPEAQLHIHLGRFGKFRTGELPMPEPTPGLRFQMTSKDAWAELRGAVAIEPYGPQERKRLEARIGPDPLNGDDPAAGFAIIRQRRMAIGALLMDQSILAGIGNIFRAEMLFRSGISPFRPGNRMELDTLQTLWTDVHQLMQYSMTHDGRIVTTEPADRTHPKRKTVARPDAFYVYHRTGKPCRHCGTEIEDAAMGGRTVFFCPHCQPE